jgi:prephenate dehydrogenase
VKVAVLGVGLVGGSIGRAARARTGAHVVGYDSRADALSSAVDLGAIDEPASELAEAVAGVDVVFVATPVGASVETALRALDAAGEDCVVSDVGSTKRQIVRAISDPRFVGGHPLAGAETGGVANAREDLFDGATWYLTPAGGPAGEPSSGTASSLHGPPVRVVPSGMAFPPNAGPTSWALERVRALIEGFGARPVTIDPQAHDRVMASVSHLPHVLANVLVAQALRALESGEVPVGDGTLGPGPSFRDATRVAGANTAIWTDIYMSNGDLLAEALDRAIEELESVRRALRDADAPALAAWNERARTEREQLRRAGLVSGP